MQLKNQNVFIGGVLLLLGLLVLLNIVFLFYYFFGSKGNSSSTGTGKETVSELTAPKKNSQYYNIEVENETSPAGSIVKQVSEHIILPDGKVTVVTIQDPEGLRAGNPSFYQYAKKGDKLVYYSNGVILYDPVIDRILDILRIFSVPTSTPSR